MSGEPAKKTKRSITDQEISVIKAMLRREIDKTTIQAYFTHPDRPVNYGRITNIEQGSYGPDIAEANDVALDDYLENWRSRRDGDAGQIAAAVIDLTALSPVHAKRLEALFDVDDAGRCILRYGETDDVESKQTFHRPLHDRLLRAVAALANNRGGYVLFGVEDLSGVLIGLKDDRLKSVDPSEFAMAFRATMEPCPRFEIGVVEIAGVTLGAVYVHRETDGPVIATRDEQSFKAGVVYYRYPGESRAVSGADFRRLLTERDRRARLEAAELAKRAVELGGDGALLNFSNGQIEGRASSLFVSPELLEKMRFIKEGEFVQKDGAPALRLVGDVSVAASPAHTLIRERIVRQGITDRDVLGNFLGQESVQYPAEYVLHSCHSNKRWLPLFYFVQMSGRPIEDIINLVKAEEGVSQAVLGRLIDRLSGRTTAKTEPSAASRQMIAAIIGGKLEMAATLSDIRKQAVAVQGWSDTSQPIEKPLAVLKALRVKIKELSADNDRSTEIRRAASWLDELYFRRKPLSA